MTRFSFQNSFQNRLIGMTMVAVTLIFGVAMTVVYVQARQRALLSAMQDEQKDLDRNVELLGVMLRKGESVTEVKRIATSPWKDGSGNYFVLEDNPAPQLTGDQILLTSVAKGPKSAVAGPDSAVSDPVAAFTVGEVLSEKEMLKEVNRTFNYFVIFSVIVLIVLFVAVRYVIKRTSQPEVDRQRRLDSELDVALSIQNGMLPLSGTGENMLRIGNLELAAMVTPSKEVGGDFYNYVSVGRHFHFIVADVSGKGVPAAIYMALATKMYVSLARQDLSASAIAVQLNDLLCADNQTSMFVTALIGRLDTACGELEVCSAGHNPPLKLDAAGARSFVSVDSNIPLGLMEGYEFVGSKMQLSGCDSLVLYTDGVTEAEDRNGAQLGAEELLKMPLPPDASAAQIVENISARVKAHSRGVGQADDVTIFCLRYEGEELRLRAELSELAVLPEFAQRCGLSDKGLLVLEEALVNVINYSGASDITVSCSAAGDMLKVCITDDGREFDPTAHVPSATDKVDELQIGGQGLRLMAAYTERMTYRREEGRNVLVLEMKKDL